MGQNSSTQHGPSSPRRTVASPRRQKAPPTPAPPPKPPNYAVAENRVLPGGTDDMAGARRLLRPVSQELTKFHPDFADIFTYDPEVDGLPRGGGGNEADDSTLTNGHADGLGTAMSSSLPDVTPVKFQNGRNKSMSSDNLASSLNGRMGNAVPANGHTQNNSKGQSRPAGTNLRRTQSMEPRSRPIEVRGQAGGGKFHRRQMSMTPVIPEDPREHLYNVARHEPFSNAQPSGASLPLASSFGLDYSFNVTYAQLADFRRKQRQEGVGQKLGELSAEISASSNVPKSPFDRNNIGDKSATRSVSTGSSETGVSKSKKKKAPAPPPPANVPPLTLHRDPSPGRMSVTTEPPADYDMGSDLSPTPSPTSRGRGLYRSASRSGDCNSTAAAARMALRNSAPQQITTPPPTTVTTTTAAAPPPPPSTAAAPPPPPPPPPAPPLPASFGASKPSQPPSPRKTPATPSNTGSNKEGGLPILFSSDLHKSKAEAKAQLEALKKLEDVLKNPKPAETKVGASSSIEEKNTTGNEVFAEKEPEANSTENAVVDEKAPPFPPSQDESAEMGEQSRDKSLNIASPPRMSSLLQHDIVLAAQARGAKVIKVKPPPTMEKPKDMSERFREELAKAASAREERRSRGMAATDATNASAGNNRQNHPEPADDSPLLFESNFLRVSRKPPQTMAKPEKKALTTVGAEDGKPSEPVADVQRAVIDSSQREIVDAASPHVDPSLQHKRPSIQSEDMSISSGSNSSHRVFPHTWTPEDDLDSDDDIIHESSRSTLMSSFNRSGEVPGEGFKSFVIPTKIDDLAKEKNMKKKEKKSKQKEVVETPISPRQMDTRSVDGLDTEDKDDKKFGSIRKFQKSVHRGVKNAFGSISKASGKLLKRRKSQEILELPTPEVPVVHSEVSMNPNWELGDSMNGSLRRTASEGHMPRADIFQNGAVSESRSGRSSVCSSEDSGSESEDDIGDIDFSAGIDASLQSKKNNTKKNGGEKVNAMKRAGVAYVSPEGQIIVLPEQGAGKKRGKNGSNKMNDRAEVDDSSLRRKSRLFKKRSKKSELDSSLRRHNNYELDDGFDRRDRNMEADYRRLQDLQAQERLHRLQTVNMQEQITLLQRQQLQRSHADLFSTNADVGRDALYYNSKSAPHMNRNIHNGNIQIVGHPGVDPTFHHHRYSMPSYASVPTSHLLGHTAPTPNPANYTAHSAPLVGGVGGQIPAPSPRPTPLPGFTPQELAYLSEYMRVMGVTPPATQQQWAVLLSTISISNNNNNNINNYHNSSSNNSNLTPNIPQNLVIQNPQLNTQIGPPLSGPDLSKIFGSTKTLDSTTSGTKQHQLLSFMSSMPAAPLTSIPYNGAGLATKPSLFSTTGHPHITGSDPATPTQNGIATHFHDNNHTDSSSTAVSLLLNSAHTTSAANIHGGVSAQLGDVTPATSDPGSSQTSYSDVTRGVSTAGGAATAGVYGPLGFRQVVT